MTDLSVYPQRRPHQIRALNAITTAYQRTDRVQLRWACGTGKTLVGRWLAEDLNAAITLVLVPSLALVAQSLAEWQAASRWPFRAVVVCSDRSTADAWRVEPGWWADHGVEVTTSPEPVTGFLTGDGEGLPRVVFSTYHSAPVVGVAARRAGCRFDLVVCDEAHRLAGDPDDRFRVALDDWEIPAARRLFVTATPVYGAVSMADAALFGPVVDRLDVAEAIAAGLLVDYQVLVLDASGGAGRLSSGSATSAALVAAAREGIGRVISFHSRVDRARAFAAAVDGMTLPDGRVVHAETIAGIDPAAQRRAALDRLAAGHPGAVTVVTNARCLTEGVDVPAVDGVIIADPKHSDVDITQAVGRALRPAPGKTRGLVILPVIPPGPAGPTGEDLFTSPYAAVWGVLRALRSMDPRIAAEIDRIRSWGPRHNGPLAERRDLLRFDLDDQVNLDALLVRPVDDTSDDQTWGEMLAAVRECATRHGHTAGRCRDHHNGRPLGQWISAQRRAYAAGALSPERVSRLEAVPGWAWTTEIAWWIADRAAVDGLARLTGALDLTDPDISTTRLDHRTGRSALTVGRWCARQRRAWREGALTDWQTTACEAIPGWTWDAGVDDYDTRMVDALAEWVETHRDANVPHDATWGRLKLGRWVTSVRRRRALGRLSPLLADDIAAVTPSRGRPGALDWRQADTRWELHLIALIRWVQTTGSPAIPDGGTFDVDGRTFPLSEWTRRQRHLHRHGNLAPDRARLLEKVPGWEWEPAPAARVHVGIGARQHGTRLGYAAGCRCTDCTAANTAYEAGRQRLRAAGLATTDLVDATAARGHLRILEVQVGIRARTAMRDVTGLNKKTIDEIINGDRRRIHPEVDAAVRALTADDLRAHIAANPTSRDQVPAGPTRALLEEMVAAGWPKAWIARELSIRGLSNAGKSLQVARTESGWIRRATADAVADLHAAIGGRTPPPARQRTALPPLADILTAQRAGAA